MQGKVEICGVNTALLPRLSGEETEALLLRARAGDAAAREKLIEQLTKEMKAAVKLLEFEHAAYLRDKIKELRG